MGKARRVRQQRHTTPRRKLVVVDACEIGAYNGMVSLRVGSETAPPLCLAIPLSAELADGLRRASLDAEELYWKVLPAVVQGSLPATRPLRWPQRIVAAQQGLGWHRAPDTAGWWTELVRHRLVMGPHWPCRRPALRPRSRPCYLRPDAALPHGSVISECSGRRQRQPSRAARAILAEGRGADA